MTTSPRASRSNRVPAGQTRVRILDAALRVFARLGYSGASIDAIAGEAGLTKGAVYSNFESKDDLFFTLLGERIRDRVGQLRDIDIPPDLDALERSRAIGNALFQKMIADADWQMLFLEFWSRAVREPQVHSRYAVVRSMLRAHIGQFIAEEAARGNVQLTVPAEQLATVVLALANGLFIEYATSPEAVPPTVLGDSVSRLIR